MGLVLKWTKSLQEKREQKCANKTETSNNESADMKASLDILQLE